MVFLVWQLFVVDFSSIIEVFPVISCFIQLVLCFYLQAYSFLADLIKLGFEFQYGLVLILDVLQVRFAILAQPEIVIQKRCNFG